MKKIGINGLGRISRLVLRQYMSAPLNSIDIIGANDLIPI